MDVVGVALQPGRVEEDVLAALLHRALGRRRRMTFKETLRREERKTLSNHKTTEMKRVNRSEKLFSLLQEVRVNVRA